MGTVGTISANKIFTIMATETGFEETQYNPNSLIIRGRGADPSIPEGFIRVNDQLQRSQAAPQPLPSWIVEADAVAEQRRQEAELQQRMQQETSAQAGRGIERAMQLEGVLGFDADRKRGIPVQEALMKWGPKMYFRNPSAVARMVRDANRPQPQPPFIPTEAEVGGQRLIQMSPNRFQMVRPPKPPPSQELSSSQKLQVYKAQLSALDQPMKDALGDEDALKPIVAQRDALVEAIAQLSPIQKQAAKPAAKSAPDKTLAREEAKATIKARPRIAEDVRKLFKQTYGEDL